MNAILQGLRAQAAHHQPGAPDTGAVYERLGVIVRELHDTLRELGADSVLADAASQFPCARGRLLHIADLTENAANVVLSKVEQHGPAQEQLAREAQALLLELDEGALSAERVKAFLSRVVTGCTGTRAALSDIMMAQDFQDLTGQLIKKVVGLMESTEDNLLKLLIDAAPPGALVVQARDELTAGPGAHGSVALDQTSVDDLLGELGF